MPPAEAVERFRADLETLTGGPPLALGVAVSGGADSLALLLLAAAAYPKKVRAATVDHGLRPESAGEAQFVAGICRDAGVPHATLAPDWERPAEANLAAAAREARYRALLAWMGSRDLPWLATGHHLDDQAETLLMRLGRGSGVAGLAGVRATNGRLVRPLLGWRKAELVGIVEAAGIQAVQDPSNDSDALDRTHARRLLAAAPWIDPARLAAASANLANAEEALLWAAQRVWEARGRENEDGSVTIDPRGLPRELQRRLLLRALSPFTNEAAIPGPKLITLLDALLAGRTSTLAGVKAEVGQTWRISPAPPRRN